MTGTVKLDRAKRHLDELTNELNAFFAAKPYKVGTRYDPETKKIVYYLTDVTDMPPSVASICGDVIQNLRSALDHLAYDVWVRESGGQGSAKKIYFPIDEDLAGYSKNRGRKTRGISPRSLAVIDSVKPYKGGNDILWRIHELNNIDKHRLLVTVGSSFHGVDIGSHMVHMMRKNPQFAGTPFAHMPDLSMCR
jgi:hypothetical protein